MPLYEYRCTKCGHQFEVTHGVAQTVERCERCGGPVRRVFTPVGIIFKGAGFHINDYRKSPAPAEGDGTSASTRASKDSSTPAASTSAKESSTKESSTPTSTTSAGTKPS